MLTLTLSTYAGINPPGSGGHGTGHAPEMTDVAMVLAGLASLGGYFVVRRRLTGKK